MTKRTKLQLTHKFDLTGRCGGPTNTCIPKLKEEARTRIDSSVMEHMSHARCLGFKAQYLRKGKKNHSPSTLVMLLEYNRKKKVNGFPVNN